MENQPTTILDVVSDIMQQAFSYLEPQDLQNVALSHSYFYSCAERLRFRTINLTVAGRRPVQLARTLLERPQFQQHVRFVELAQVPEMNPLVPNMLLSPHPVLSVNDEFPFDLLNQDLVKDHLQAKGLESITYSFKEPGYNQPELLALLFSLMPNISRLKMDAELFHIPFYKGDGAPGCLNVDEDCDDCHWDDDIADDHEDLSLLRPLRTLKEFHLNEGKLLERCWTEPWAVYVYPERLHHVPGMLNAAGLRHYSGILPDSFLKILLDKHDGDFHFMHLNVKMTLNDPSLFQKFLARTPRLKTLVYKHYWVSNESTLNFEELHRALLHVSETLESLHITTDAFYEAKLPDLANLRVRVPTFDNLLEGNFGTLQGFAQLKSLILPGLMLIPVRNALHSPVSSTSSPLPLTYILPDSLTRLEITDCLVPLLPPQPSTTDFQQFHRTMIRFAWTRHKLRLANAPSMSALNSLSVLAKTNWLRWPEREFMDLVKNAREEGVELTYDDVPHGIRWPNPRPLWFRRRVWTGASGFVGSV